MELPFSRHHVFPSLILSQTACTVCKSDGCVRAASRRQRAFIAAGIALSRIPMKV